MNTLIKQLINRPRSVSSQLPHICRIILIHFFCQADIVVTAYASSLVLAEHDGSLVLSDNLIALAESALVAFEVDEGLLVGLKRRVNCSLSLLFVVTCLVHDDMHMDEGANYCRGLFVDHFLHFCRLFFCLFLLLVIRETLFLLFSFFREGL